jgi:hypothetical protein
MVKNQSKPLENSWNSSKGIGQWWKAHRKIYYRIEAVKTACVTIRQDKIHQTGIQAKKKKKKKKDRNGQDRNGQERGTRRRFPSSQKIARPHILIPNVQAASVSILQQPNPFYDDELLSTNIPPPKTKNKPIVSLTVTLGYCQIFRH